MAQVCHGQCVTRASNWWSVRQNKPLKDIRESDELWLASQSAVIARTIPSPQRKAMGGGGIWIINVIHKRCFKEILILFLREWGREMRFIFTSTVVLHGASVQKVRRCLVLSFDIHLALMRLWCSIEILVWNWRAPGLWRFSLLRNGYLLSPEKHIEKTRQGYATRVKTFASLLSFSVRFALTVKFPGEDDGVKRKWLRYTQ